jgi:hypothetical protein
MFALFVRLVSQCNINYLYHIFYFYIYNVKFNNSTNAVRYFNIIYIKRSFAKNKIRDTNS